jgi:hypothetical protein
MFAAIEKFSEPRQHTIAALGAFSTLAAVVVSLALALVAQRSSRTRIRAKAYASFIFHSSLEGKPKPKYVSVSIANVGLMSASIPLSCFHWKIPFNKEIWMVNPWDVSQHDPWVPQHKYPAEIRPRGSDTFFIGSRERFRETMSEIFAKAGRFRWRYYFIRARVVTEDGKIFKVKLDKEVRREIAEARRTAFAAPRLAVKSG